MTDRRRFTETGEERSREDDAPAVAAAADARVAAEPGAAHGSVEAAGGIQSVFYILWQGALLALGAQDAGGHALPPDLAEARGAIGLLQTLEEKTRGNLTAEEQELLRQLLHDAQMRYVQVAQAAPRAT